MKTTTVLLLIQHDSWGKTNFGSQLFSLWVFHRAVSLAVVAYYCHDFRCDKKQRNVGEKRLHIMLQLSHQKICALCQPNTSLKTLTVTTGKVSAPWCSLQELKSTRALLWWGHGLKMPENTCDLFTSSSLEAFLLFFFFFSSPGYILLTFAPAINQYQMCRQPSLLPDESLQKTAFSSLCESPNGSSYAYSANGHRFESHHNPFEKSSRSLTL